MAESVKRRVAAARLAVAFAAAGAIAGGTAWAQGSPASPTADASASDYLLKANSVKSQSIINGSLLFKDFKKGQVPSALQFNKLQRGTNEFKQTTNDSLATLKTQIDGIKGELGSFVKLGDADSRYVKVTDAIVRGDGSVFTGSKPVALQANTPILLASAPGMVDVSVKGTQVIITNTSGQDLGFSTCTGNQSPPPLSSGKSITCTADGSTDSIQFFSWGELGASATISFSSVETVPGQTAQATVQILIGL